MAVNFLGCQRSRLPSGEAAPRHLGFLVPPLVLHMLSTPDGTPRERRSLEEPTKAHPGEMTPLKSVFETSLDLAPHFRRKPGETHDKPTIVTIGETKILR